MNKTMATFLGLGILLAPDIKGNVLYSQFLNQITAYASDTASSSTLYDDFTLPTEGIVTAVDWDGTDPSDFGTGFSGFDVKFLSNNGGLPGAVLASDFIPAPDGEGFTQEFGPSYPIYGFGGNLTTPFTAAPETEYFLSIAAVISGGEWYWQLSNAGNNGSVGYGGDYGNSFYVLDTNEAFALVGTAIPEPATIALGFFGASAFLFRRRK